MAKWPVFASFFSFYLGFGDELRVPRFVVFFASVVRLQRECLRQGVNVVNLTRSAGYMTKDQVNQFAISLSMSKTRVCV